MEIEETRESKLFFHISRSCADECVNFVSQYYDTPDYESQVQLAKVCAVKCMRLVNEWSTNSPDKHDMLRSCIFACDISVHEFSGKKDPTLTRYIHALQSFVDEGRKFLNRR